MFALNAAHLLLLFQIPAALCGSHIGLARPAAWVGQLLVAASLGTAQALGEGFVGGWAELEGHAVTPFLSNTTMRQ